MSLELAIGLIVASLLMTFAGGTASAVGVWVLIRTARVSKLEQELGNLSEMLQKFRNREARRVEPGPTAKPRGRPKADADPERDRTEDPEEAAAGYPRKLAEVYANHLRKGGA